MKKALFLVLGILLIVAAVLLFWQSSKIQEVKRSFGQLPSFTLRQDSSLIQIPAGLPSGKWDGIILIKFDSECSVCQIKAQSLKRDLELLESFVVIMASSEEWTKIDRFSMDYDLKTAPNFVFGQMSEEDFYHTFKEVGVPYTFLFDQNGTLLHQFSGNPSLQALLGAFYDLQ